MKRICNMLTECFEQGYTIEDLKFTVVDVLSSFFNSTNTFKKYWTDAELLSNISFVIISSA